MSWSPYPSEPRQRRSTIVRDVLDGRADQPLDPSGQVELRVDGHQGQWLRVLAPGEQAYA